jgi:PAS domain S-box-containing protein
MNYNRTFRSLPSTLIFVFLFITAGILITGHLYYQSEENKIVNEKQNELSAIADLKVEQINQWINDRLGDAKIIFQNISLVHQVESFFRAPEEIKRKQELRMWIKSLMDNYSYSDVYLIEPPGTIKLSGIARSKYLGMREQENIKEVIKRRAVFFSDLYKSEYEPGIHLDILVPLLIPDKRENTVIVVVLLRIDPFKLLFPLIQSWPTPSRTSETLLLRWEGDSVLFLNELRHRKNTALTLRLPVSQEQLPAAMAARGVEGTVEGIDYRDIPVLVSIKRIPNSPWFLVAKVDQEEIYTPFHKQMTLVLMVVVLIILVVATTLGILWRHQRLNYYRRQYQEALERQALISHFDYLFKYANDIIILADKDLNIIEANDRALETYGCTRSELIGLNVARLRAPRTASQLPERIRLLDNVKTATYETIQQRKDGSTFPIEISVRVIEIEGKKYYQSIGRNITERKRAEEVIQASEARLRRAELASKSGNWELYLDSQIMHGSEGAKKLYGVTKDQLEYVDIKNIPLPEYRPLLDAALKNLIEADKPYDIEFRIKAADTSEIKDVHSIAMFDKEKRILFGIVQDITVRKQVENALFESEEKFRAIFENNSAAIAIIEPDTTISMVNDAYCKMSGYTKLEVVGMSWTQQIPPEDLERLKEYNRRRLMNPKDAPDKYEFAFYHKNGEKRYGLISIALIQSSGKIAASFIGITDRKRAEEALKKSEETYRTIFENTGTADLLIEEDTIISFANEEFEHLSGYSKQEIEGKKKWTEFVVQEDVEQMLAQHHLRRKNQEAALKHYEFQFLDRSK